MDIWSEMEKLVEKGLVKHIGMSNFNAQQIQRVFDCPRIKLACNEIEFHDKVVQRIKHKSYWLLPTRTP